MTNNLTPSESHSEDLFTLDSENVLLEIDAEKGDLEIAKLVELKAESLSFDANEVVTGSNVLQPSLSQSSEVKTEESLSSNPFTKLGLVGTATLAILLFAGGFFWQLMMTNNQLPENSNIASLEIQPPTQKQLSSPDLEEDTERSKTKFALTQQVEAVKLAQQQLRAENRISASQLAVKQNSQLDASRYRRTAIQKIPTPMSTVYIPRTITVERIVRVPDSQPTRFSQPSSLPQAIAKKPTTPPLVNITPSPTPNPLPETPQSIAKKPTIPPLVNITPPSTPNPLPKGTRLTNLDSYKEADVSDQLNVNPTTRKYQENDEEPQRTINPQSEPTPKKQPSVLNQGVQQSPKSIAVGSHAKAVLATALFGETSKSTNKDKNSENKNVFVVRLKEPLKAVDGAIAIPANTELLTEIQSLSEQGLLQLDVVKIIMQNNGKLTEKSLPKNAMMIRAPQGKPLIANQFPNQGSSILSMDIGLFALGGLGKAAELSNRTESQVVTTNAGGTVISNTNPQRNILAGALEGGMNTVVPQIAQRNQQAISQMSQRTNVWFLPAGTAAEIYVNQVMQF